MKATWRHVSAPSPPLLSYEEPSSPSESAGSSFHSLHATSHALHPMQMEVSVKKPFRRAPPVHPESAAGLVDPKNCPITLSFPDSRGRGECLPVAPHWRRTGVGSPRRDHAAPAPGGGVRGGCRTCQPWRLG